MTPAPRLTAEELTSRRALAVELLTALATARGEAAIHEARLALLHSGLSMMADPIGVPCPADTDPTIGLTLGCPTTKTPAGTRIHRHGHASCRLTARIAHATATAKGGTQ